MIFAPVPEDSEPGFLVRNLEVIIVLAVVLLLSAGIYFLCYGFPKRGAGDVVVEHEQL